jgi:hypothetical protein
MTPQPAAAAASSQASGTRARLLLVDAAGAAVFLAISLLLMFRLSKGLDLSDESYYALFVDDWLKGSISSSSYLVVHQTAALLVLPFAWLFVHLQGSTDGMFLFLRYVYLLGSTFSSAIVVASLHKLGLGMRGWVAGLLLLAFIPFGLPAPSYNTIGMQALCVALAAYGRGTATTPARSANGWFAVSAAAWTVTTIAYPPLIVGCVVMAALLLLHRSDRRLAGWRYLAMLVAALVAGWSAVAAIMSVSRLRDSAQYTAALAPPGGLQAKLGRGVDLLADNRWYALLCFAAITVGLVRRRFPARVTTVSIVGLVALSLLQPPVLVARSHDVVTLLALTGIGLIWDVRPHADPTSRLLGILFTVSFVAGLTTMIFATNLLFNFCIGAAFAASLTFAVPAGTGQDWRAAAAAVAGLGVVGVILTTSLTTFYGDNTPPDRTRHRITGGFFAGIHAGPDDVNLLKVVQDRVAPLLQGQTKVVYIGRNPGVILTTPARMQMLSSYPFAAPASPREAPKALAQTADFYSSPRNRPPIVIIYRDPLFVPANPMGSRFTKWYHLIRTEKTPLGALQIFRRR